MISFLRENQYFGIVDIGLISGIVGLLARFLCIFLTVYLFDCVSFLIVFGLLFTCVLLSVWTMSAMNIFICMSI